MSIMLGVAGCMAAAAEQTVMLMTRGDDSALEGNTGYEGLGALGNPIGDLEPDEHNGQTVFTVVTTTEESLYILIAGERNQDFFRSILCSLGFFATANADTFVYNPSGDYTQWVWENAGQFPGSGTEYITFAG